MSFRDPASTPGTGPETTPGQAEPGPVEAPPAAGAPETSAPPHTSAAPEASPARPRGRNMLPERERRRFGLERLLVRLVATCGIIGIGVVIAAIMASSKTQGWIIGLVVALVSVILSAILWSSRQV